MDTEAVFVFCSTNEVIQAEKILLENLFLVCVMPLPAAIRAGCGICLRLPLQDAAAAKAALTLAQTPAQAVYVKRTENKISRYYGWKEEDDDGK